MGRRRCQRFGAGPSASPSKFSMSLATSRTKGPIVGRELRMAPDAPNDIDWGAVFATALAIALEFVPAQDAKDVVLEGIRKVIEGSPAWTAASGRSLPAFVVTVGYNERRNRRRKEARGRRPAFAEKIADATTGTAP